MIFMPHANYKEKKRKKGKWKKKESKYLKINLMPSQNLFHWEMKVESYPQRNDH
jgi:hypothetical protein